MSQACFSRDLANIHHAPGVLSVSVWDQYSPSPRVCSFSRAPGRDCCAKPRLSTIVVCRPDMFTLHRRHRRIRMRHRKKTSSRRQQDFLDARLAITVAEISLGLLIVSWKIVLLGIRVGGAAVPGSATTTQTQPNGANHIASETRGSGRAQLREAHSVCMLQHTEERSRERRHRLVNVDQKSTFARMVVAGVA